MEIILYGFIFCFGAIIGSFLNVVIYRMHTGKSLSGRSHCLSCGVNLSWYELFPIFSYIAQGAKCRSCNAYIPSRYLFVELLTAFSFVFLWSLFAHSFVFFVLHIILVCTLIVLTLYDVRHTIIPDELTATIFVCACLFLGLQYYETQTIEPLLMSLLGGVLASGFFAALWFVSKGRWIGFGDAKLALPLGIIVGLSGVFSMVVLSFWIGAVVSLSVLGIQRLVKRGKKSLLFLRTPITMKSEVPFAPFLVVAFLLVHLYHVDIFSLTKVLFPF